MLTFSHRASMLIYQCWLIISVSFRSPHPFRIAVILLDFKPEPRKRFVRFGITSMEAPAIQTEGISAEAQNVFAAIHR
jgi:hypothetical protein